MLPSLTSGVRPGPARRALAGAALACLVLAAVTLRPEETAGPATAVPLARRLDGSTVAFALPGAWLAAPLSGLVADDRLDIVGVRPGDLASVFPLAADARVLAQDERALTVAVRPDDAAQLALARANGLLVVPLLRAKR